MGTGQYKCQCLYEAGCQRASCSPSPSVSRQKNKGNSLFRAEKAIGLLGGCPVCHMTRPSAPLKDGFHGGEGERRRDGVLTRAV